MVDNWNYLKDRLDFSDSSKFYMIQLQQRKKDDASFPANNRTVKTYFISSLDDYLSLEKEIKKLSDESKSRVYIRVNRRSFEEVALETNKDLAQILRDKNFQHLKNLVPSAAGKTCSEENKLWIVDVDVDNKEELNEKAAKIINYLMDPKIDAFRYTVPTLNGIHIITTKFDSKAFLEVFPGVDIHKDNPTLLYFNPDAHRSISGTD